MSSVHLARQGFITKATLPSVSRERGTTTVADNSTVLLLNGNGTNGKQNNTFVTENFGSAGGQGNYSVAFDGSGDFLSFTGVNSAFEFGTGDFTVECWVNPSATPADAYIWDFRPNSNGAYPSLDMQSSKFVYVANSAVRITGTTVPVVGQWYHVAISRSGTSTRMFVNGVQEGSTYTDSTNYVVASGRPYIGTDSFSNTLPFTGYISNFRIVKGTAVYTSAFTPPTSELTAISGTSLLTCQGTVIRDASSNNFAITVNGDAKVASNTSSGPIAITRNGNATQGSFSPFTLPDGQWSNFFDGTGDYLAVGNVGSLAGDFTVECWVYFNSSGQVNKNFYLGRPSSSGTGGASFGTFSTADRLQFGAAGIAYDVSSTNTIPIRQWVHVAAVRSGSNLKLYINGVNDGSVTQTRTYLGDVARVGGNEAATNQTFDGYISNMRVVTGTALYTANFTPPTTPLTAITNTSLLTCQSNRFRDNSSNNFTLTRNGDVRVTPWSPFAPTSAYDPSVNGGSAYFDGTGDFINTATSGTTLSGNFTIEGWVYINALGATRPLVCVGDDFQSTGAVFYVSSTGRLGVYGNNTALLTGTTQTVTVGSWNHVAFVRSSGTITAYLNGVADSTTASNSTSFAGAYRIGGELYNGGLGAVMNGYIANFRTVAGTAVYTSAFTPPTAPVTNITNTSLLLNFTNAGIFDTAGDNVIETVGNAQIDTAIKKYGSGSLEFDGTGDYLLCYSPRLLPSGREPFTIEAWIYLTNSVTSNQVIVSWGTRNNNQFCGFSVANNTLAFYNWFNDLSSSNLGMSTNTWYHVAAQYDGTTKRIFFNGVQVASATTTTVNIATTDRATVGAQDGDFATLLTGYIDDLRITKGVAKYTAAGFTPPTTEAVVYGTVPNIVNNSTYGVYQLA